MGDKENEMNESQWDAPRGNPVPEENFWTAPQPDPPKPKPKRLWLIPACVVAAFLLGIGAGASANEEPSTITAVAPTVTRTLPAKAAAPLPAKTVTIERAPKACQTAMDSADRVISVAGESMLVASKAFDAVADFDVDALTGFNEELNDLQPRLESALADYGEARTECLG